MHGWRDDLLLLHFPFRPFCCQDPHLLDVLPSLASMLSPGILLAGRDPKSVPSLSDLLLTVVAPNDP
jgi:hypothetical protein